MIFIVITFSIWIIPGLGITISSDSTYTIKVGTVFTCDFTGRKYCSSILLGVKVRGR